MKKIFILITCIFIFSGCHSMQKLRVNYNPKGQDSNNYYKDKEGIGHDENVKYTVSKDSTIIEIPIKYTVTQIQTLDETSDDLEKLMKKIKETPAAPICDYCNLSDSALNIKLYFKKNECDPNTPIWFLLWPLLPITVPLYTHNCTGFELYNYDKDISLVDPFRGINNNPNLGINIDWKAEPNKMYLNCNSKSCMVLDDKGKPVNQIIISKNIKFDQKKIKKAIALDKKQQVEKEANQKRWHKTQQEQCIPAIRMLEESKHKYVDPVLKLQATKTYVKYYCDDIMREILEGY